MFQVVKSHTENEDFLYMRFRWASSSDVFVADILKEFGLKILVQDVQEAETVQIKARQG
jgi:hypothetical protein